MEASENLVSKALRVWGTDRDRADRYLEVAARFPYSDSELAYPLLWTCHMELFNAVTDAVEASSENDHRWLDAALALLEHPEEMVRVEITEILNVVRQDVRLTPCEAKRIRQTCSGYPTVDDFLCPPLAETAVRAHAAAILSAVVQYADAWAAGD